MSLFGGLCKKPHPVENIDYSTDNLLDGYALDRGHLAASADRNRNKKDNYSTYLTSNIVPQHRQHNNPLWSGIEEFGREIAGLGKELYIFAGGYGSKEERNSIDVDGNSAHDINIPEALWRVVVVLDRPGMTIDEINESNTEAFAIYAPNTEPLQPGTSGRKYKKWFEGYEEGVGGAEILTIRQLENRLNSEDERNVDRNIRYDFLSNISKEIQDTVENRSFTWSGDNPINAFLRASLLASTNSQPVSVFQNVATIIPDTTIWHSSIAKESVVQDSPFDVSVLQSSATKIGTTKIGTTKIGSQKRTVSEVGSAQVSSSKISFSKTSLVELSLNQLSPTQISTISEELIHARTTEISTTQMGVTNIDIVQGSFGEVPIPAGISFEQFFTGHNLTSTNAGTTRWNKFIGDPSTLNLKFEIKDLAGGQLAETQITRFGTYGNPLAGTIYIDDDANGLGWFIDETPWESSEFSHQNTEYNYEAQEGSVAYGRYDLLTTILHELGHFSGFISGHEHFDTHVENGVFRDGDLTAAITADGSHLADNPLSLLSPYLTPGMRKLPSELELRLLESIRRHNGDTHAQDPLSASQTAVLTGISNGDFESLLMEWKNRGAVQTTAFNTSTAISLTEDSPILSQLSQTFVIPQDATQRYLTFDLLETNLGSTDHRPPDAFEVALIDSTTLKPLVGTAIGITNTDALLNLQSNGTLYLDDDVTVTALGNGHRRVRIDLGDLAPSTTATLYFDLLGFGAADSRITIDNVKIGAGTTPPLAVDDTTTMVYGIDSGETGP